KKKGGQDIEEMERAKYLTGGYVNYLRENAEALLNAVQPISGETKERIIRSAVFIAYLRARPPKDQTAKATRELASRLTAQLTRMAICLAAVLNKDEVDDEVMGILDQFVLDTAFGDSFAIVQAVVKAGREGIDGKILMYTVALAKEVFNPLIR